MVMNHYEYTVKLWDEHKTEIETRISDWADRIEKNKTVIQNAKKLFQKWRPLRFYTSVTKTKGISSVVFSVRFYGQEIAELYIKNDITTLVISKQISGKNKDYFGLSLKPGKYDWKHDNEAILFRKHFKQLIASTPNIKTGIPEHHVESVIISEMEKKLKTKFGGAFSDIQPVTIESFPFQMPLPISASSGKPAYSDGKIDILARRRCSDGKVRISVWELKKPRTFAKALDQVYIYSVCLSHLLRSSAGKRWYKIFGFNRPLPEKLEIEAVVVVTSDQKEKLHSQVQNFIRKNPIQIGNDLIKLSAAYYNEKTFFVESFEENLYELYESISH